MAFKNSKRLQRFFVENNVRSTKDITMSLSGLHPRSLTFTLQFFRLCKIFGVVGLLVVYDFWLHLLCWKKRVCFVICLQITASYVTHSSTSYQHCTMIPTIHAVNIVIKQPDLLDNCRIIIEYFCLLTI